MISIPLTAATLLGAAAWTGVEYSLHRFVMHEKRGPELASREHLMHHADVTYFSPMSKKLLSAAATTAGVLPVAYLVAGPRAAIAFTAGMIVTYFAYEVAHRRIHTHAPINGWGRWMRRHHLRHHFGAPARNHGVTTPLWDRLFRTTDVDAEIVTVPRRMAPVWLLDEHGEVRSEYATDYRAKGRRVADDRDIERDRIDAFANRAPVAVPA
jgi:sterol desaturase/sphingolipid hydroxylase (fatty acid hydroxylase superfamily)